MSLEARYRKNLARQNPVKKLPHPHPRPERVQAVTPVEVRVFPVAADLDQAASGIELVLGEMVNINPNIHPIKSTTFWKWKTLLQEHTAKLREIQKKCPT